MKHEEIPDEELDNHLKQEMYLGCKLAAHIFAATQTFMKNHEDRGVCVSVPLLASQIFTAAYMEMQGITPDDIGVFRSDDHDISFPDIGKALEIEFNEEKGEHGNKL